jgi:dsDNA-specific endonuclease/ATPase MutS2
MKLKTGDIVRFLNEKGEGTISKIINKTTVAVTISEGLEIPYPAAELVLVFDETKKEDKTQSEDKPFINDGLKQKININKYVRKGIKYSKSHQHNNPKSELEIDLHIEELIDNFSGMSNFEIVQVQLNHFNRALDRAINGHYRKLIVIHGVGNGRLKQEVRNILSLYDNLRFYDASYSKYGFGATEILIS